MSPDHPYDGSVPERLELALTDGRRRVFFGGDRFARWSIRHSRQPSVPGDRLVVVQATGALLHIPAEVAIDLVDRAVARRPFAFDELARCDDERDLRILRRVRPTCSPTMRRSRRSPPPIDATSSQAESAGRSTTRLELIRRHAPRHGGRPAVWRDEESRTAPGSCDGSTTRVGRSNWRRSPLGVVGFVFEGRPNVFADAVWRGAQRQHGGLPHRLRRVRHRPGDRRARAASRAASWPAFRWGGAARSSHANAAQGTRCSLIGASRWRSPADRGERSANWGRGVPGRYAGEPARHRRGVDDRR